MIASYCKFKIINYFFTELQHMETVLNSVVYILFFTIFIKKNILQQLIECGTQQIFLSKWFAPFITEGPNLDFFFKGDIEQC